MQQLYTEQLSLFASARERSSVEETSSIKEKPADKLVASWDLFIDGAARRNPGPAGVGIYILKDGMPFFQEGYYLGEQTNNQAEYTALLVGLYFVEQWKQPSDTLKIFSDSQLLVRQIQGMYRVRNADLIIKHRVALHWFKTIGGSIYHIPRDQNSHADSMANKGIDLKKALPSQFITRLQAYEVALF